MSVSLCVLRNALVFPSAFAALSRPPAAVWVRGELPSDGFQGLQGLVALVGSRAASGAGVACARLFAETLAQARFGVVSGGALGIDAAAHEGALGAGGWTWAVLGCGVDIIYPDRHKVLFAAIEERGGLLSEFPPGTPPRARQFPSRNRLIVALAHLVVVIEAAPRSGALVTARLALRAGKVLAAVPGTPGTDALVAEGVAVPVVAAPDLVALARGETLPAPPARPVISGPQAALLAAFVEGPPFPGVGGKMRARPSAPDELAARLGWTAAAVMAALTAAELEGLVLRTTGGRYVPSAG